MTMWLSTRQATGAVEVDGAGIVRQCAPIWRTFRGQHVDRLRGWLRRQGGYRETPL